jgi:hypothetical protein
MAYLVYVHQTEPTPLYFEVLPDMDRAQARDRALKIALTHTRPQAVELWEDGRLLEALPLSADAMGAA